MNTAPCNHCTEPLHDQYPGQMVDLKYKSVKQPISQPWGRVSVVATREVHTIKIDVFIAPQKFGARARPPLSRGLQKSKTTCPPLHLST
jgi:hypothetical protein